MVRKILVTHKKEPWANDGEPRRLGSLFPTLRKLRRNFTDPEED